MEDYWQKCVLEWYPELLERTHFLPPLHFNRVSYSTVNVAGESILVQQDAARGANQTPSSHPPLLGAASVSAGSIFQKNKKGRQDASLQSSAKTASPFCPPVSDSDVRDDNALFRVLLCLRELSNNNCPTEVMMVVLQLQYLHQSAYEAAASLLPRPRDLEQSSRQGDFDILIIHRRYGLITGEIKSVGANFDSLQTMTDLVKDSVVAERVREVTKQLNKAEIVLKHLVSDLKGVNVTKTLIIPNVNRSQLLNVVRARVSAQQGLSASNSINVSILVFGCMMMVGGFFLLLLPETHGKKLPDSISDVEIKRMVSSNNVVTVAASKVELWTPGMGETENTYM